MINLWLKLKLTDVNNMIDQSTKI